MYFKTTISYVYARVRRAHDHWAILCVSERYILGKFDGGQAERETLAEFKVSHTFDPHKRRGKRDYKGRNRVLIHTLCSGGLRANDGFSLNVTVTRETTLYNALMRRVGGFILKSYNRL